MATLPVRHHRCPECGDHEHLYAEAECRWSHVAQQWILECPEDNPKTECTSCDWQGNMGDTEYHDDPADEPCPVNRRPKGTCPDGCTHGEG